MHGAHISRTSLCEGIGVPAWVVLAALFVAGFWRGVPGGFGTFGFRVHFASGETNSEWRYFHIIRLLVCGM